MFMIDPSSFDQKIGGSLMNFAYTFSCLVHAPNPNAKDA